MKGCLIVGLIGIVFMVIIGSLLPPIDEYVSKAKTSWNVPHTLWKLLLSKTNSPLLTG